MTREEQLNAALIVANEYKQSAFAAQLKKAIKRLRYTPEDDELIADIEAMVDATGMALGIDELRELAEQIVDLVKSKQSALEPVVYTNLDDVPNCSVVKDHSGDYWYVDANGLFYLKLSGLSYYQKSRPTSEEKADYGPYVVVKDEPEPNSSNIKQ